jgi:signal transduction histidine kinase
MGSSEADPGSRRWWSEAFRVVAGGVTRRATIWGAVAWVVLCLPLGLVLVQAQPHARWGELIAGMAGLAIAAALSGAFPLLSLAITTALSVLQVWGIWETSFWPTSFSVAMAAASFLAGRRTTRRVPVVPAAAGAAAVIAGLAALSGVVGASWVGTVALLVAAGVLPWLAGRSARQRAELMAAGWARAEQAEREQRIVAEQARLRERWRIAQDMHDSLGHDLSLIGVRAGGLEMAPDLEDRHREVARELRLAASAATERLGEVIGMLREGTESAALQPVGESIAHLVERARAAGIAVRLDRGDDATSARPVVERAVYRVVREALTNAAKHAPGAEVTVQVEQQPAVTVVTVANAASPPGAVPPHSRGGHGLAGLRERARLLGGDLHAGAREGGFEVIAWLPHLPDAASGSETATQGTGSTIDSQPRPRRGRYRRGRPAVSRPGWGGSR